jgi:ADP-heptose:LPS heptosyltransferase
MAKILIIRLGAFGDILQSEGAIHDIRLHHPGDEITLLTTRPYQRIYERCPWIDHIMIDPRNPRYDIISMLRLRRTLKGASFDKIYDLQNSKRTRLYRNWLDADWSQKDETFNLAIAKRLGRKLDILERIALQLEQAGIAVRHTLQPNVSWMADDASDYMQSVALKPGFVILFAGSSARHHQKRWPHFNELARLLVEAGHVVVTAPGPDEMKLCQELPCPALLDRNKPISFNLLAGLIRQAGLVIGNDTGPTHLAAYLNAKGLALFGPHTSARSTGLDRFFAILEVSELTKLNPREVCAMAIKVLNQS